MTRSQQRTAHTKQEAACNNTARSTPWHRQQAASLAQPHDRRCSSLRQLRHERSRQHPVGACIYTRANRGRAHSCRCSILVAQCACAGRVNSDAPYIGRGERRQLRANMTGQHAERGLKLLALFHNRRLGLCTSEALTSPPECVARLEREGRADA